MSYPARKDPYTGEMFNPGRRNQRFACQENRIAYHNRTAIARRDLRKQTHHVLERNHKILLALLTRGTGTGTEAGIVATATVFELQTMGFDFEYITRATDENGKKYRYVYDLRYVPIDSVTIQIEINDAIKLT